MEKIISSNSAEELRVMWDKTRFGLIHVNRFTQTPKVILLSPKEALELINFAMPILQEELNAGRI